MEKDHYIGLVVLLCIIAAAVFGGQRNSSQVQSVAISQAVTAPSSQSQTPVEQLSNEQSQVTDLQQQLQAEQVAETHSLYYGLVSIQFVNRATTSDSEYIVLHMLDNATTSVQITGWRLQSLSSGQGVTIPDGTLLFFSGTVNGTSPIVLTPGDNAYIISGTSPIGYNFRLNKCSGYLSQYQTFIPYISTNCPTPENESSTSIPNIAGNDACLDYINSLPSCQDPTAPIPVGWNYECTNFITTKLNYNSCIDAHKNDSDFYLKEWRIYLGRSDILWQNEREDIVLYDNNEKIVSELTY